MRAEKERATHQVTITGHFPLQAENVPRLFRESDLFGQFAETATECGFFGGKKLRLGGGEKNSISYSLFSGQLLIFTNTQD